MINKILLTLGIVFNAFILGIAQSGPENFSDGVIVNLNGDTMKVKIKQDREERMSMVINVWDAATNAPKKYYPKELAYFKVDNQEYFSKNNSEGKKVFMEAVVKGEASLYRYSYKEKKGNKSVRMDDFYAEKKGKNAVLVPDNSKFKTEMANFFADAPHLTEKINNKIYKFNDIENLVVEYNEWVKAGKPKNDDRFTSDKAFGSDGEPRLVSKKEELKGGKIALEIPIFGSYNFVNYPTALNDLYRSQSLGMGYDVGLGAKFRIKNGFHIKLGVNVRNKGFRATGFYLPFSDQNGTFFNLNFNERANLLYPGAYMNVSQEWKYFFLGAGFNLSFFSGYSGRYDYTVVGQNGGIWDQFNDPNAKGSFLVNDILSNLTINGATPKVIGFNTQFDINITIGGRFELGDRIILKPCIQYTVPMVPLYNSNIFASNGFSQTELNVSGYQIKFGLITDLKLSK